MLQKEKKLSPKKVLDDVFDFATKYPNEPMVLSASLMVVAKTIYLNRLGPEQTQLMIHLFADNVEHEHIEKVTIH